MSDYKDTYSEISSHYVEISKYDFIEKDRYERSKLREKNNNYIWEKQCVNLNDVVNKYILDVDKKVEQRNEGGVKYIYEGSKYIIKCDKAAGYLRIFDKKNKMYCTIDGIPSRNNDLTHFKIKKREEM